jgi:hypothetical protein
MQLVKLQLGVSDSYWTAPAAPAPQTSSPASRRTCSPILKSGAPTAGSRKCEWPMERSAASAGTEPCSRVLGGCSEQAQAQAQTERLSYLDTTTAAHELELPHVKCWHATALTTINQVEAQLCPRFDRRCLTRAVPVRAHAEPAGRRWPAAAPQHPTCR